MTGIEPLMTTHQFQTTYLRQKPSALHVKYDPDFDALMLLPTLGRKYGALCSIRSGAARNGVTFRHVWGKGEKRCKTILELEYSPLC